MFKRAAYSIARRFPWVYSSEAEVFNCTEPATNTILRILLCKNSTDQLSSWRKELRDFSRNLINLRINNKAFRKDIYYVGMTDTLLELRSIECSIHIVSMYEEIIAVGERVLEEWEDLKIHISAYFNVLADTAVDKKKPLSDMYDSLDELIEYLVAFR